MRIGLVGCGFIAHVHSRALWALRKAGLTTSRVTRVCDDIADRAATLAAPNAAQPSRLDELLDDVDCVYVCTPTARHADVVEAAADRGLPVYCEKPLAPTLTEAERVAAALARIPHQVGLVLRCSPVFETVAAILGAAKYGRVIAMSLRDDQYFPIQGQYGSTWRSDRAVSGGGTLIEHSIHDVDLFRWMLGDASRVSARTHSFFGHEGIDDLAAATLDYADGHVANLLSIWHQVLSRPSTRRLEVFCEDAFMWTDNDEGGPLHVETSAGHKLVAADPPRWVDELPVAPEVRRTLGMFAEASRRFLVALETGDPPSPDASDALAGHRVVDAAYRSAATGGAPVAV